MLHNMMQVRNRTLVQQQRIVKLRSTWYTQAIANCCAHETTNAYTEHSKKRPYPMKVSGCGSGSEELCN